jgi:hypothetical protein
VGGESIRGMVDVARAEVKVEIKRLHLLEQQQHGDEDLLDDADTDSPLPPDLESPRRASVVEDEVEEEEEGAD